MASDVPTADPSSQALGGRSDTGGAGDDAREAAPDYPLRSRCNPLRDILHRIVMKCRSPSHPRYKDYGGRGIGVCREWYDPDTGRYGTEAFVRWALSHGYQPGRRRGDGLGPFLTLGRRNVNGDYTPANCVFAPAVYHARRRRSTVHVVINGVKKSAVAWCRISGVPLNTFHSRMAAGYDPVAAVCAPKGTHRSRLAARKSPFAPEENRRMAAYFARRAARLAGRVSGS